MTVGGKFCSGCGAAAERVAPNIDELKNSVFEIFKQAGYVIDNFYLFDHIPPKKLKNAAKSYASALGDDETVIFLYDDTVGGSAKNGFVLTTKRLYSKNDLEKGNSADVEDIFGIDISHTKLYSKIGISSRYSAIHIHISLVRDRNARDALLYVLNKTILLLNSSETVAANRMLNPMPTNTGSGTFNNVNVATPVAGAVAEVNPYQYNANFSTSNANTGNANILCPICGTAGPLLQTQAGVEKKGLLRHLVELVLILIPIIGWGILIYSLVTDVRRHLGATCQRCGYHWVVKKSYRKVR